MRQEQLKAFIGSTLSILLLGSLQPDTSLAAERPDFSGTWQLNEELSENPRDKMKEEMGRRRGRGGSSGGGPGMGRGAGGEGSRGGQRGSGDGVMQERFQSMMERVRTLEIAHQDPELVIGYADGSNRTFFTDGREIADDLESGTFGVESRWKKGSQIVVESENAMGGKVSEVYRLGETDETLEVSTTVEGGGRRPEMSFKRVYERTLAVAAVEGAKATDDLIDSGSSADDQ